MIDRPPPFPGGPCFAPVRRVVHLALNKPNVTSLYFAKAVESFERYKAQFAATALDNLSALPGTGLGFSRVVCLGFGGGGEGGGWGEGGGQYSRPKSQPE